jgi:hypothetical protein
MYMKKLFVSLFAVSAISAFAQPKGKEMRMAAEFSPGYYINLKGDTVRGEVQYNHEKEDAFYRSFFFRPRAGAKPMEMNSKKATAYGYEGNNFTMLKIDEEDKYIKILENGRLKLMEYKSPITVDGVEKYKSTYFIVDTRATADDKTGTDVITQLPERNHKKALAKFFKDQPILLDQVDKWYFKIEEIRKAVTEFNAMYTN